MLSATTNFCHRMNKAGLNNSSNCAQHCHEHEQQQLLSQAVVGVPQLTAACMCSPVQHTECSLAWR